MQNLKKAIFPYVRPVYNLRNKIRNKLSGAPTVSAAASPQASPAPYWHYVHPKRNNDAGLQAIAASQKTIVSQDGEDGILLYLIDKLKLTAKTCLEVGAWDGKHLSNTWNLIENHGWKGVLIELETDRYNDLPKAYSDPSKNIYINAGVEFTEPNSMDNLLKKNGFNGTMDLMSIDIDGNDWHILNSIEVFKPNLVVIEFNPSVPNHVYFVSHQDCPHRAGSSLAAFEDLGKKKGYECIFVTNTNIFMVKKELFPLLGITHNELNDLRPDQHYRNTLFHGWDGTVYITGQKNKLWQPLPVGGDTPVYLEKENSSS